MADWPDADELKQVLNVESDDWETTLERVRQAAIAYVKKKRGEWDEDTDVPTEGQAQAALRMAELISERPAGISLDTLAEDPTFQSLMFGTRRKFGVA